MYLITKDNDNDNNCIQFALIKNCHIQWLPVRCNPIGSINRELTNQWIGYHGLGMTLQEYCCYVR